MIVQWVVKGGIEVDIGANPSAEGGEEEAVEDQAEKVVDIVDTFRLQEQPPFDKKAFAAYLKVYAQKLAGLMPADRVAQFRANSPAACKWLMSKLADLQFFVGDSMNSEGSIAYAYYKDGAANPTFIYFKDGLKEVNTCLEHGAEGAKTAYGKGGSGGRDMQKGSIRTHQRSTAHQDAHAEMKSKESRKLRQTLLSQFEGLDRSTLHIITALKTTVYICKSEAPITSYVGTIKFMDELGVPNLPLDSKGNYFSEEALAAKDAAEKVTEFNIIDQAVRNVAEQLSRSSNWHRRFEHLQEYICETNLELQGIHDVRWLSRGEAVKRFAKVLPATIVLLHDFKHALYETVTSFKFHFMLFFLADILAVLNELNAKFQKQQVTCGVLCNYSSHAHSQFDITVVAGEVSLACRTIDVRYVDYEDRFGNDQSPLLCAFLKKHGNPEHREVAVKGVDQNGEAAEHEFVLHERKIPGHKTGGDYYSCKAVCQEFARVCVARLEFRLEDLKNLAGSKLFRPSCYPDDNAQRMKKCREWLGMLDHMFHHRLFGVSVLTCAALLPARSILLEPDQARPSHM
ncbi:unnamed protein product [Closterium sp. Naga37s-1]|nr:unnamed protein product [Closterium sp. Naga37s-1]